jgi:hypothetical protein
LEAQQQHTFCGSSSLPGILSCLSGNALVAGEQKHWHRQHHHYISFTQQEQPNSKANAASQPPTQMASASMGQIQPHTALAATPANAPAGCLQAITVHHMPARSLPIVRQQLNCCYLIASVAMPFGSAPDQLRCRGTAACRTEELFLDGRVSTYA